MLDDILNIKRIPKPVPVSAENGCDLVTALLNFINNWMAKGRLIMTSGLAVAYLDLVMYY